MTGAPVDPVAEVVETPAGPAPAPTVPAVKPLRIKSFTLCDFRAFAGPETVTFNLGGRNLLIYGENGAGKSSIFHALDEFFSAAQPNAAARKKRLAELENIFPATGKGNVSISVTFDDGSQPVLWNAAGHPADTSGFPVKLADARVVNAAYRKAALDYRALLDTNYRHGKGSVNLFEVCVRVLLRDYPVLLDGKQERLFDLWNRIEAMPRTPALSKERWDFLRQACDSLNAAFDEAVKQVIPKANAILAALGWGDVQLERLEIAGLRPKRGPQIRDRSIDGQSIVPRLKFREKSLAAPQNFLNEARLSALALAIYFAGRQVCAATLQSDTPRLMVLDDVLIGLDQSNRLPVLDLIATQFKDWQIVLLTHDRAWFEMARSYHRRHVADKFWHYARVHSNDDPNCAPTVTYVDSSAASEALKEGREFLKQGHINAAGNYARIAVELALREFCEIKKIPVAYQQLPDKTPASDLLTAAKVFSKQHHGTYDIPLAAIDMYTAILFNKLSHGGVPAVTQHEVQGALNSVDTLLFALKVVPTGAKPSGT